MTRTDLIAQLAAIERRLEDRITVTRVIIDKEGRELRRITRVAQRPTNDTQQEGR